jgi:uncharacterized membrane protein
MLNDRLSGNDKTKKIILAVIEKQQPESLQRLIKDVQKTENHSDDEIMQLLIELNQEKRISLRELRIRKDFGDYVFSLETVWYWCVLAIAVLTALVVLVIPENLFYMLLIRNVLGLFLVLYLPGFVLLKNLFPQDVVSKSSPNLNIIERITLNISLSLAISGITGLALYYTIIGLNLLNVTVCLVVVTVVLSTTALLREYLSLEKFFKKARKNAEYFVA